MDEKFQYKQSKYATIKFAWALQSLMISQANDVENVLRDVLLIIIFLKMWLDVIFMLGDNKNNQFLKIKEVLS